MLQGFQPLLLGGRGNVFIASAIDTAMPAYTATALGGPLLYNGGPTGHSGVTAYLIAMGFGLSVASTAAVSMGIAGGVTTAPTSTTAISIQGNAQPNLSNTSVCTAYSTGTVSAAATFFMNTGQVGTAAITSLVADDNFIQLGGVITIPPGSFAVPAASATMTTGVMSISLVWIEVPNT